MSELTIKLIPVSKELPKRDGDYICLCGNRSLGIYNVANLPWRMKHKRWNVTSEETEGAIDSVVFWAEIPVVENWPEGEEQQ